MNSIPITSLGNSERIRKTPAIEKLANLLCSLAFHAQTDKLFALLDTHRNVTVTEAYTDSQGQSPLHFAAACGDERLVAGLAQRCPLLVSAVDRNGDSPLVTAVQHGNVAAAKVLLNAGTAVDASNFRGRSALHFAATAANKSMLQLLLDSGAFVGVSDCDGASALHCAAVSHGLNGSQVTPPDASVVERDVVECIALLVARGALVNARDSAGDTPLHWAARESNASGVRALLDAGADASLRNDDGETARAVCDVAMSGAMALDDVGERAFSARCADLIADAVSRAAVNTKKTSVSSNVSSSFGAHNEYIFV